MVVDIAAGAGEPRQAPGRVRRQGTAPTPASPRRAACVRISYTSDATIARLPFPRVIHAKHDVAWWACAHRITCTQATGLARGGGGQRTTCCEWGDALDTAKRVRAKLTCVATVTPPRSLRDNVEEYNTKWGLTSPLHGKGDADGPPSHLSVLTPRTGLVSTPRSRGARSKSPTRRRRGSKSSLLSKTSPVHMR